MKFRNLCLAFLLAVFMMLTACGTAEQEGQQEENIEEVEPTNGEVLEKINALEQLDTTVDIHQNEQVVLFDIKLKNNNEEDVNLTFTSGQQFEIVVTNNKNEEVYRYSINKSFIQAVEDVVIPANESLEWHEEWVVPENLPRGEFQAAIEIVASHVNGEENKNGLVTTKDFQIDMNNSAFRNIEASGKNGEYVVKGEARVFEGSFLYTVEEGHDYLIEETAVQVNEGAPEWSSFELKISIPQDQLPVNGTLTLSMYERSAKDNSIVNQYFVKLDEIGY
ncbi:BsuPI-related putative proteinase inhibitor [Bacillus sp. Marseille-P3661]|uniref:BsuPI-related putative proteinase inhibitor n=1 Tax=Bacillus sp. Marseille-P3661 TaxID=1936234 RepID=UPI000C82F961|nr:BsuPI-related putative proteinase inhibitor [Bacillus sp. Marseille-P3661]